MRGRTPPPPSENTYRLRPLQHGAGLVFAGPATGSSPQLFFGPNPVFDIFSVFAAALNIQLMSSASRPLHIRNVDYLPFAETLIFICFGLDSSRFAICRVKTPLRYSARMLSELTVFGREKLRMNEP